MTEVVGDVNVGGAPKVKLGRNYWTLWSASVVSNLGDGVAAIAYPWLASAITRDPVLIALIAVAQRLPWLFFSLPAGVITDRLDRKKIMSWTSVFRTVLTGVVALAVLASSDSLPSPGDVAVGVTGNSNFGLYVVLVVASLLFGMAEVLFDNSAQTILPAIVEPEGLEKANGRLWGGEMVANLFVGPPLGSLMIGVAFVLPFVFDMSTLAIAAVLIFAISGMFTAAGADPTSAAVERKGFWTETKEGVSWLWAHALLRPMAIILGLMNGLGMLTFATFILFSQEVLGVDAFTFALITMVGAVGGITGAVAAPKISKALGSGPSLYVTLLSGAVTPFVIGFASHWLLVGLMFGVFTLTGSLWNVITVSLRQTIIPDHLLGRVNSVYRFFAWGMMPIGLLVGGLMVAGAEAAGVDRTTALRLPWWFTGVAFLVLFFWAAPKLTTRKIEAARTEGVAAKEALKVEPDANDDGRRTSDDGSQKSDRRIVDDV